MGIEIPMFYCTNESVNEGVAILPVPDPRPQIPSENIDLPDSFSGRIQHANPPDSDGSLSEYVAHSGHHTLR
jgi:hypothetical protein